MDYKAYSIFSIQLAIEAARSVLYDAQMGRYTREQIEEKKVDLDDLVTKAKCIRKTLQAFLGGDNTKSLCDEVSKYMDDVQCSADALSECVSSYQSLLDQLYKIREEYVDVLENYKNFNKRLCFSNIRSLLVNNDNVKIGQIEKSAGLRAGYMSRLEKDDNQSEPAIEFVVTAAKFLNVSLDLLISVDLSEQTEADRYLLRLLDKLKLDSINNRLKWELEPVNVLNGFEPADIDERPPHNLFVDSVIDEEGTITRRFVFNSNAFGKHTIITDNCYNLRLKNGKYLYLMNVGDKSYLLNDKSAKAREIWICGHNDVPQYVVGNRESETLSLAVDKLFDVVQSRITRPRLTDDAIHSLDAFMNDDLTDDPLYGVYEGDIPF